MKKSIIIIISILLIFPIFVNAESKYLYDVLKNEAESGGLAKEYTGEHHDSFTEEPSKKIYHWYAENDDEGNQVIEKNNVIFANHCWQILRTTDTGGVKLLYNGKATSDNKCNNSESRIAYLSYNLYINNYTYNYSTDYSYDETTNKFTLTGNIETIKYNNNFNDIKDKYTCLNNGNECT